MNRFNELENLAEFYIFIWGTAPGGDEDIWAKSILVGYRFKNEKSFSNSNDESRLSKTFSVKRPFFEKNIRSNDHFSKKAFGQMTFRSNGHFSEKAFG
jgi:hypothetical protein